MPRSCADSHRGRNVFSKSMATLAAAIVLIAAALVAAPAQASTPSAATRAKLQRELDRSVNARVS